MAVMGCQKDDSHSEQSVKAILESFLSCSVQDVQEYQNTYLGLTAEAVGDQTGESGIASVGGLEQYLASDFNKFIGVLIQTHGQNACKAGAERGE